MTGTELGESLQSKVVNYTKGAQHPQYGKIRNPILDEGDFVFLLDNKSDTMASAFAEENIGIGEEMKRLNSQKRMGGGKL